MKLVGRKVLGRELGRRHVVAGALGFLLLALAAIAQFAPEAGLRWGLARTLKAMGMAEVSIEDTDIALFGGQLTVRRVVAQPVLGKALGIGGFDLKFRWAPLLNRRLVLDRVAVQGIEMELKREAADGFVLNGLPLAVAATPSSDTPSQPWTFGVASVELADSRLRLVDGDFTAEMAVDRLVVENIDSLDPLRPVSFSLRGSVNGAALSLTGTTRPFAARPSLSAALQAKGLELAQFARMARRAGLEGLAGTLGAALAAEAEFATDAPRFKVTGRLEVDGAQLAAPAALRAERLELELGGLQWDGERAGFEGRLGLRAPRAGMENVKIAAASLGVALESLDWRRDGKLRLAGKVESEALAVTAPGGEGAAERLSVTAGQLEWDGQHLAVTRGRIEGAGLSGRGEGGQGAAKSLGLEIRTLDLKGNALAWQGGFAVTGADIRVAGHEGRPEAVEWTGRLAVDTASGEGKAEGRVGLKALGLGVGTIRTSLGTAELDGSVAFGQATAAHLARASLTGLAVHDSRLRLELAEVERLEVEEARLDKDGGVLVRALDAGGVNAIRRLGNDGFNWRIETRRLHLDQAGRDGDGDMDIGAARVEGLLARLNRGPDGLTGYSLLLPAEEGAKPAARSADADERPEIRIGRLALAGAQVNLRDRTMAETVRLDVTPLDLTLGEVDSGRPGQDTPFTLKAGVGRGLVQATGSVRPFAARPTGKVEATISSFELPPFSPYLAQALGVNLQSGHFDGTLGLGAAQGVLDGKLDLALSNLFIAPPDAGAPPSQKAGLPIETALDLLRDGEDRIRLSLPIRGDTANPDIDISDAVAQAVGGALKSTMLTTLKLAFPVAALLELALDEAGDSRLALPPLAFEPAGDTLSPDHLKILAGAADLLQARPSVKATLCGRAGLGEWPAVAARRRAASQPFLARLEKAVGFERDAQSFGPPDRNVLMALAQRRAEAVRNHLVDKAGIPSARLFGCRPLVEEEGKGPRVEVLF